MSNSTNSNQSSAPISNAIGMHNIAQLRLAAGTARGTLLNSGRSSADPIELPESNRIAPIANAKLQFLVLGAPKAGKTSLLRRLQNLNVSGPVDTTIGPDIHRIQCGEVEAIDIGGSEHCYPIARTYCELMDSFVVMFDLTDGQSFLYARYWLDYIEHQLAMKLADDEDSFGAGPEKPRIVLVGNKKDLVLAEPTKRQVSRNLARNLAAAHDADYCEISAKQDLNLEHVIIAKLERNIAEIFLGA